MIKPGEIPSKGIKPDGAAKHDQARCDTALQDTALYGSQPTRSFDQIATGGHAIREASDLDAASAQVRIRMTPRAKTPLRYPVGRVRYHRVQAPRWVVMQSFLLEQGEDRVTEPICRLITVQTAQQQKPVAKLIQFLGFQ